MRRELAKYFSDPQKKRGLLLAQAPTGYGKTYETVEAICQYVCGGGRSQVLFLTNLLKNLPVEELRRAYARHGMADRFERDVLLLGSTASTVEKAILEEQVPDKFQTEAYWELRDACEKKRRYQQQGGEAATELAGRLEEQIRLELEPRFRRALRKHLEQAFPEGPAQCREAIRHRKQYRWMAQFYPAIFWADYKIILLSVKKLMARNVTLVEHSFDCLSDPMVKDKIICIDEFDASRAMVLDCLLDRALQLQTDYLQLFLQVYRGITTHHYSHQLETARKEYEAGRGFTWAKLLGQARAIYRDGALSYSIKTVDAGVDRGRNFLFHDTSYHTVLHGNRTHVRAVCSRRDRQVQIHFETREVYQLHRDEPKIVLQNLLRRIYVFLQRFQRYVYGWAERYAQQVNAGGRGRQEVYTTAAAAESIFADSGLTAEQIQLMMGGMEGGGFQRGGQHGVAPDLSFYETGFRLFEFLDDDHHHAQTYLQYLQMGHTPERVLLSLCRRAKVVGLSATAELPTVLGNYDLRYLKERLKGDYQVLSPQAKQRIDAQLEQLWAPYRRGEIQIRLEIVDKGASRLTGQERLERIFAGPEHVRFYGRYFAVHGLEDHVQKRYCDLFTAMKIFWAQPQLQSLLCLNQVLPAPGKWVLDEELLARALEDLRLEQAPQDRGALTVLRSGQGFEGEKEALIQALQRGEKRFVLSSYQTLGAGQNLQYPVEDTQGLVVLNGPFSQTDSRFQSKDFDGIYLGDVTHGVVNLYEQGQLAGKDLLKYCFQVECLYENDEISFQTLHSLLKDGIGRFSGQRPLDPRAQRALRTSDSLRGQITRDVIQAVGRIGRTFLKRPVIYLFSTKKVLGDLAPGCLEGRLLSPEMEVIKQARAALGQVEEERDTARNEAERKATRGKEYLMRMLGADWVQESMALWKALRQIVLCLPRAGGEDAAREPVIQTYYIPVPEGERSYFYAQKGDFSQVFLSWGEDKEAFAARLPRELAPCVVSEEEARLGVLLSYPGMQEYFAAHGWATSFGAGPYMISPVLFQNVYKGALGEVCGWFILQRELGLQLRDIEDPGQFEAFDYVTQGGIYWDFKHWKGTMQQSEESMREKILGKLDGVGGKRAFVINLIADGTGKPARACGGRIVEIPGLLFPDGKVNREALDYIGRWLE